MRKFTHKIEYHPSETSDLEACLLVESGISGQLVDYLRGKGFLMVQVTTHTQPFADRFDLKTAECRIELQKA